MYVPAKTFATETIIDNYCIYLLARLEADPKARHLAPKLMRAVVELKRERAKERSVYHKLKKAEAQRDYADYDAGEAVRFFHKSVLVEANRDRTSFTYRRFFKHGLTPVSEASAERRVAMMQGMESALESEPESSLLKAELRRVAQARADLQQRVEALETARLHHERARQAEVQARVSWQEAYRVIHASLVQIFPSQRKKVETFFHRGPKKRKRSEGARADEKQ